MASINKKRNNNNNNIQNTKNKKDVKLNKNNNLYDTTTTKDNQDIQEKKTKNLVYENDNIFWAILRLIRLLCKGAVAVVIFMILFNLTLVILNKSVLDGKITKYIPKYWYKNIYNLLFK